MLVVGTLSAFAGAYVATRHLDKITLGVVSYSDPALMLAIGVDLAVGILGERPLSSHCRHYSCR